jgi:hypothetical protein
MNNDPRKWQAYGICDAARATHHKADRTSIGIFTTGPQQRVFLVDWVLDRMEPGQRGDAIVRLIRKWKPVRFTYEEIAYSSDTFYLNERLQKAEIDLRLIPVGGRGPRHCLSKHERICQIAEWWREGRIVLPRQLLYTQVDGKVVDLITYFVNEEFLPYRGENTTRHDDGLDMFSRLLDDELRLEFDMDRGEEEQEDGPNDRPIGRGGWEALY